MQATIFYTAQISTGLISSFALFLIVLSLLCSKHCLRLPYQQIIFSISMSNLLLSLAAVTGPFTSPADTRMAIWARGSIKAFKANGFFFVRGQLGVYCIASLIRKWMMNPSLKLRES